MTQSPFLQGRSHAGKGEIHLKLLAPKTPSFSTLNYTYPLKLVCSTPHKLATKDRTTTDGSATKNAEQEAQATRPANVPLVFMLSYGGGLLPPDSIDLSITLDAGTRLTLTTQGSTKVFPSSSSTIPNGLSTTKAGPAVAKQTLTARLEDNAALLLAPDPVQPFARSNYSQAQIFTLASSASLCLLDWVIEGRKARGESWQAESWRGRNEIWREFPAESPPGSGAKPTGETEKILMLRDAVILDGGSQGPGQSSLKREGVGIFGTIIITGPLFEQLGKLFMSEFVALPRIGGRRWGDEDDGLDQADEKTRSLHAWRAKRVEQEVADGLLWTAADIRSSVVVKFSANELEGAKRWLESMWRWDGTIGDEFGDGGFMCLR